MMLATGLMPSALGADSIGTGESFVVTRMPPGPPIDNKETRTWVAPNDGLLWLGIENDGLSSVTIQIVGGDVDVTEVVRFQHDLTYSGESTPVEVEKSVAYDISGIPGGPPDNTVTLTVCFESTGPTEPELQISYTISEIGESYLKSTDYADLGARTDTPGLNSWWDLRKDYYGETPVSTEWPYTIATASASPLTSPSAEEDWPWYLWTFYRMNIEATLPGVNTAAGSDPIFIPLLDYGATPPEDRLAWEGGTVEFQWHGDYLTQQETDDIKSEVHYANTYYGADRFTTQVSGNDGWYFELHGTMAYDTLAAKKFLGLPGVGDLRDEFTTANLARTLDWAWLGDWVFEGGDDGPYDTYTAYEYSNDMRGTNINLHPDSTADQLVLKIWTVSWGMDAMLMRYAEAADIHWQAFPADITIGGVIGPEEAVLHMDYMGCYNMLAWKDTGTGDAAWQLTPMHMDYGGNTPQHMSYISPYNDYDADEIDPSPMAPTWTPGIMHHGQDVFYMATPLEMDLRDGETFTIVLPTETMTFYEPYVGTDDGMPFALTDAKVAELLSHRTYGDMTIGTCVPDMSGYYDGGSNVITIEGPVDFPTQPNTVYPNLLMYGAPEFIFSVV